jgi:hypothetical protein
MFSDREFSEEGSRVALEVPKETVFSLSHPVLHCFRVRNRFFGLGVTTFVETSLVGNDLYMESPKRLGHWNIRMHLWDTL